MFGDPHVSPFLDDPTIDCLILVDDAYNIPFDDATLEELKYYARLERSDDTKTSLFSFHPHVEITSTSLVVDSNSRYASLKASSDSLQ